MKKFLQLFILSSLLTGSLYSESNRRPHIEIEEDLINDGEDIISSLMQSVDNNEFNEVRNLLRNNHDNIDINHQDLGGNTLLHLAAFNNNPRMVQLLLRYHADPNIVDNQKQGALHASAGHSNDAIMQQLLNAGANPNTIDNGGRTPLHIAAMYDKIAPVQLLLDRGADRNIRTKDGQLPIDIALNEEHDNIVNLLQ
ncbi:MAG: ankyrin repeat domain-containing protein [Candidatus Chromulinivorax sp.]|nr:ankyrin repeat domain-containing protein [Candidatus Chromulinivorax sp.]